MHWYLIILTHTAITTYLYSDISTFPSTGFLHAEKLINIFLDTSDDDDDDDFSKRQLKSFEVNTSICDSVFCVCV